MISRNESRASVIENKKVHSKICWLFNCQISQTQAAVLKRLFRCDAFEHVPKLLIGKTINALGELIRTHPDDVVLIENETIQALQATQHDCSFYVLERHPRLQKDGSQAMKAVYRVLKDRIEPVWENKYWILGR